MKSTRSLLVSWMLGASVVALVTFSFEALSAREAETAKCPVTGAIVSAGPTASSTCPAMERRSHFPVTGATAGPAPESRRCPATGATARPEGPSGRCPAGGTTSGIARPGLRV